MKAVLKPSKRIVYSCYQFNFDTQNIDLNSLTKICRKNKIRIAVKGNNFLFFVNEKQIYPGDWILSNGKEKSIIKNADFKDNFDIIYEAHDNVPSSESQDVSSDEQELQTL